MNKRVIWFLISVILGIGLGIFYGWVVNPVQFTSVGINSLRSDYQADYVLMVAEMYHEDKDLSVAEKWLKPLGDSPPGQIVQQAVVTAQELDYYEEDLEMMIDLSEAFVLWSLEETQDE